MADKIDFTAPYEGPIGEDPFVVAFQGFKVNSAYYARLWLNTGVPHVQEHPIITERLQPWRDALLAAGKERREAVVEYLKNSA